MNSTYEVYLLHPASGAPLALIDEFERLEYAVRENAVGAFELTPGPSFDWRMAQTDARIVVWRSAPGSVKRLAFAGLVRYVERAYTDAHRLTIKGPDYNEVLARRIIAYAAGSAEAEKSGLADNVMKAFVRENLGSLAAAGRDLSGTGFSVAGDLGQGTSVSKAAAWRNLLTVLGEIAEASRETPATATYFGVVPLNAGFQMEFRTQVGQWGLDHRYPTGPAGPVIFDVNRGNMVNPEMSMDRREEISFVYGAGQGEGAEREIVTVSDEARIGTSPLNRCEGLFDGRNYATTAALTSAAKARLLEGEPVRRFGFDVVETPTSRLGVEWDLGDFVTAQFAGEQWDMHVAAVGVRVVKGVETVTGRLEA